MKKSEFIVAYTLAHGDIPNSQLMDILCMNNCFDHEEQKQHNEEPQEAPLIDRLYVGAHLKTIKPLPIRGTVLLPEGFVVEVYYCKNKDNTNCKVSICAHGTQGTRSANKRTDIATTIRELETLFSLTDQPLSLIQDTATLSDKTTKYGANIYTHQYKYIINTRQINDTQIPTT